MNKKEWTKYIKPTVEFFQQKPAMHTLLGFSGEGELEDIDLYEPAFDEIDFDTEF